MFKVGTYCAVSYRQAIGASCIRPLAGCAGAVCGLTDGGDWGMTEGVGGGGGGDKGGAATIAPGRLRIVLLACDNCE